MDESETAETTAALETVKQDMFRAVRRCVQGARLAESEYVLLPGYEASLMPLRAALAGYDYGPIHGILIVMHGDKPREFATAVPEDMGTLPEILRKLADVFEAGDWKQTLPQEDD